jgi:MFS superfamily sulfate permease-like transporter
MAIYYFAGVFMFKNVFAHVKRDALAGIITGSMAVPLSVGICLMSDYPIMTGLYTVIFACMVSFITSQVRPGNFVGTPGVAAGLAPALALGIATFGIDNMPFIIMITAIFQMIVWFFKWERHILAIVPHYLVEGLLAGVGLKIAVKFIPFLYDTQHAITHQAIIRVSTILSLSVVSFLGFIWLYNRYKKTMPAIPYLVIMGAGIALSFVMDFPMVHLDSVPFMLRWPLPTVPLFDSVSSVIVFIKMLGFALMLGTIDVIEQVMSNVAIEKLDPLGRKCDSNNSLLCIWMANLGATFFGGMTNLDGLAKSTTNAVAGAVTKLSNLFTAGVLLIVVLIPSALDHFPKYALGIIMVYSGWKMIANLQHVKGNGRYAMVLAVTCGLLVFKLGIFEGLLIVLVMHGLLQYAFARNQSAKTTHDLDQFTDDYRAHTPPVALPEQSFLHEWVNAINTGSLDTLCQMYDASSVFTPAFSSTVCHGSADILKYYTVLLSKKNLFIKLFDWSSDQLDAVTVYTGQFGIGWVDNERDVTHVLRFSMTVHHTKIITQHTSLLPIGYCSISEWETNEPDNFVF